MNVIKIRAAFLIGLSFISLSGCEKEKPDCDKFKTGVFLNKRPDGVIDTRITRTAHYQIEEYYKFNGKCTFKIVWTDDCSYELIFESGNEACNKVFNPGEKVFVTIIATSDDTHTVEGYVEGSTKISKSTLISRDN